MPPGGVLGVTGSLPGWEAQLSAWCRSQGHQCSLSEQDGRLLARVIKGNAEAGRWRGALKTGHADPALAGAVADQAQACWGLAARGATVEAGSPAMHFRLDQKSEVWADSAADLYAQAAAAQWNADTAIDWTAPFELPDIVEDAVVQVLTYLIENEEAALVVIEMANLIGKLA